MREHFIRSSKCRLTFLAAGLALLILCGIYMPSFGAANPSKSSNENPAHQIVKNTPLPEPPSGQIAFVSYLDNDWALCAINSDGKNERVLLRGTRDCPPSWSPDGKEIAVVKNIERNHSEVFVVEIESGQSRQLTHLDSSAITPSWSPDGKKIAFAFDDNCKKFDRNLWVMNSDGSNIHRLTRNISSSWNPVWSPDGNHIAFTSGSEGSNDLDIYIVNSDGTNLRNLTNSSYFEAFPSWSPVDNKIYFTSGTSDDDIGIYHIQIDGSRRQQVKCVLTSCGQASVSPDGKWLALVSGPSYKSSEIYLMHLDTGTLRRLTYNSYPEESPIWSPQASHEHNKP